MIQIGKTNPENGKPTVLRRITRESYGHSHKKRKLVVTLEPTDVITPRPSSAPHELGDAALVPPGSHSRASGVFLNSPSYLRVQFRRLRAGLGVRSLRRFNLTAISDRLVRRATCSSIILPKSRFSAAVHQR